jgi:hypothetical protein
VARLSWNDAGESLFEKGLDRGVLYLTDRSGVPWNGLRSVEEDPGGELTEPLYFDGIKYLDRQKFGDYSAVLTAITFPEVFLEYEGIVDMGDGLFADDQPPKPFSLSYRTLVGNDIKGLAFGYQVHLLYNLTAIVQPKSRNTLNDDPELTEFSWQLDGVPVHISGYRPTAHLILDSTLLELPILQKLEDILYGDDEDDATLPDPDALISALVEIIDNGDGTWTAIGPDSAVHMLSIPEQLFEIASDVATVTGPDTYTLSSP